MRKIDIFNHILPPVYFQRLQSSGVPLPLGNVKLLKDMDARVAEMGNHEQLQQVLTLVVPEALNTLPPAVGTKLAAQANDEMAGIVARYPERFLAGIATVCLKDMEGSLRELRRAIEQLGLRGVQIATTCDGENLSEEKYLPLFEMMAAYDLPVLIHPCNGPNSKPDFIFNWPLETTWMMINLSLSGVFERFPGLKLVTHHLGAMVPTFHNRIYTTYLRERLYDQKPGMAEPEAAYENLKKFYCDTALYGNCTSAIAAGLDFFGLDHILFGTDYPLDGERGADGVGQTANTIASIRRLDIPETDKERIFNKNALNLLKLL